jgi:preprotein translocase subunit Sss1
VLPSQFTEFISSLKLTFLVFLVISIIGAILIFLLVIKEKSRTSKHERDLKKIN